MRMTKEFLIKRICEAGKLKITQPHEAMIKLNQLIKYHNMPAKNLAVRVRMNLTAVKKFKELFERNEIV